MIRLHKKDAAWLLPLAGQNPVVIAVDTSSALPLRKFTV